MLDMLGGHNMPQFFIFVNTIEKALLSVCHFCQWSIYLLIKKKRINPWVDISPYNFYETV